MDNDFYRAFEDKYRGSRELIKLRLSVYLPFVIAVREFYSTANSIDLGCGRGEWIELMQDNGINVLGVDLDRSMLKKASEKGLNVRYADAIQTLQRLEDSSQIIISAFHLIEHLPFGSLETLVKEALRVLKPGGILIMETPNSENITVGTSTFYLDPTHSKPIPHQLLSFLVEYIGFEKNKVLRLQQPEGLEMEEQLNLISVLNGVSPDYAVIAQKSGPIEIGLSLKKLFDFEFGLSLEHLANKYDFLIKTQIQQAEQKAQQAEQKAQQAEQKAQQAEQKAQQAEQKALLFLVKMTLKKIARKFYGIKFFRNFILFFLNNFPTLKSKLQAYIFGGIILQHNSSSLLDAKNLTRSSEIIYSNLKKLIKK
jgi:2-polyprenyl-3-methyl-5-hydroxy-6-metoxy-1,4-benzoquinol methylase